MIDNKVNTVEYLKIDAEGHDPIILKNMMDYCDSYPQSFPKKIKFESNFLIPNTIIDELIS